jgi:O-antigen ligase
MKLSQSILQPQLSILVFGLACFGNSFEKEDVDTGLFIYILSSILAVLWSFYYFDFFGLLSQINTTNTFNNKFRDGIQAMPYIGKHPIYFALISVISILISLRFFIKDRRLGYRMIIWFNILIQLLFLIFLAAKMAIVSLLIGLCVFLLSLKKGYKFKTILLMSLIGLGIFLFQIPVIKNRFLEYQNYGSHTYPYKEQFNSISIRNAINLCTLEAAKIHFLTGVGIGNDILLLKDCYASHFDSSFDDKEVYNEHNQYAAFLLRFGILGILLIIVPIVIAYVRFKKSSNYLFQSIILVIAISMLSENILDRSVGAYLFSFFMYLSNRYEA